MEFKEKVIELVDNLIKQYDYSVYNELLTLLNKHEEEIRTCNLGWSVDDFYTQAEITDIDIEDCANKEVESALKDMINNHDAGIGINWNTVNEYLIKLQNGEYK